jgi:predicted lysophospholipase L1 biosynthesis ABC-type transport system permease subunit
MSLAAIVFSNHLFYAKKVVPVILICSFILLIPAASILLVNHIRDLADKSLAALDTELILQYDQGNKEAADVRTTGLMEPFNLHSFGKESTLQQLRALPGIKECSSAFVLWQFDPQNTLSVVGIDPAEPPVGFRSIEKLLTKGSGFFSSSNAEEVLLERHFATLFRHKPGTMFTLAGHNLKIVGLVDFKEQSNLSNAAVFLPYETALSLSGQNRRVINQVFIALKSSADIGQMSQVISRSFPQFSLISKDSLYKNLSAFNRLIYRSGNFIVMAVSPLALLLLVWTLKLHRLEFTGQIDILRILGWPKGDLWQWLVLDTCFLLIGAITVAAILTASVYWGILPYLKVAPLLDQGFHL